MKIATWNIERLKHKSKLTSIIRALKDIDADILILTESDIQVHLDNYKYQLTTPPVSEIRPGYYKSSEVRVSIYTNYPVLKQFDTYENYTSLCAELQTERGNLIVYGTIIGIYGNRHKNFMEDLPKQISDFQRLSQDQNFCIAGDFNISFSDNYYYTKAGRDSLNKSLECNNMTLVTQDRKECIDHIAVSSSFIKSSTIEINEWNDEKLLSDHKGICIDLR